MEAMEDLVEDRAEDCLLLCDNLRAQVADDFKDAVHQGGTGPRLMFGPKNATHVWQPCDHHVGARYKFLMGQDYDKFMLTKHIEYPNGKVPTDVRRRLLTEWAGNAYRTLETEREEREAACSIDPTAERSLFYRAFQRTGCLVTADGTGDEHIRPHAEISRDPMLNAEFRARLRKPWELAQEAKALDKHGQDFIINLDSSESEHGAENSEDTDDEPAQEPEQGETDIDSSDDGNHEPLESDMELGEEDERERVSRERNRVIEDGNEIQLGDFDSALRIADQFQRGHGHQHALDSFRAATNRETSGSRKSTRVRRELKSNLGD